MKTSHRKWHQLLSRFIVKFKCNDFSSDLFQTALHEIGHILGLKHSTVDGRIMYPYLQNALHTLHDDDIDSVQALYGSKKTEGKVLKIRMKFS